MAQAHQKFGGVIGDTAWQIMQGALNTAKIPMKYLTGERQPGDYEQATRDALEVVPYAMGGGVGAPRGALGSGPVRPAITAPTNLGRGYAVIPPSAPGGQWLLRDPKGGLSWHSSQDAAVARVPGAQIPAPAAPPPGAPPPTLSPGGALSSRGPDIRIPDPIRTYHGSPHDFAPEPGAPHGRFDINKIGSGEGNQVFSRGLYTAEAEGVGKTYRDMTTPAVPPGHPQYSYILAKNALNKAIDDGLTGAAAKQAALKDLRIRADRYPGDTVSQSLREPMDYAIKNFDELVKPQGKMYEVNLHAKPDDYLHWDRSLSDQPQLKDKLQSVIDNKLAPDGSAKYMASRPDSTGQNVYRALSDELGGDAAASQALNDAGIPGVRYLDQGSRTGGLDVPGATHNYVSFDPRYMEIVRKYGMAGLIAGGGGAVAATTGSGEAKAAPMAAPGGRFGVVPGAAAPQQNPNTQQVMFGGEQAAVRLGTSAETPAWVKSAAPPASGPGMPVEAAKDLADKGVSGRDVFYQTGWFRGADGTWQWVLPDAQAKLNTGQFDTSPATPAEVIIKPYTSASGQQRPGYTRPAKPETLTLKPSAETRTLPDVLDHPELYNAYPELRTATVERLPPDKDGGGLIAAYDRTDNKVMLSANRSEPEIVSTLLHEMQHGVQKFEGMAPGGSDSMFLPVGYYDRLDAAREGIKQARDATAKIIDPDTADSLTNLLIEKWVHNDNTPANNEAIDWYKRKLPSKDYNALVEAVSAMYPVQLDKDRAYTRYQNLVGETQSRKVQTEYETGNYNQYPPDMPNFAPPEQQIIRQRGKYGTDLTPGRQYQEVDHDPFVPPAEAGSPMTLTPTEGDPWKFNYTEHPGDPFAMPDSSNYQLPAQQQMPLPVVPAQPTAALSPSGPDSGDANLKWSWGNEYAAPAPNNPADPQNIALNITQPQDYPNYAQAY